MNITRMPATITHVVSTAEAVSLSDGPSAAAATAGSAKATSSAPPTRAARRRGPARSVRLNIEESSLVRKSALRTLVSNVAGSVGAAGQRVFVPVSRIRARHFDTRSKAAVPSGMRNVPAVFLSAVVAAGFLGSGVLHFTQRRWYESIM